MAAVTWGCDVKRAEEPQFGEVSVFQCFLLPSRSVL